MRTLVAEALTLAGENEALAPIAASAATTLVDAGTRFNRIAIDYETRDGTVRMPRVVVTADGAEIRARGEVALDGSVTLDGALLPGAELARAITEAAPALDALRSTTGALAIPFTLRVSETATTIAATSEYRDGVAAALAGKAVAPLEIAPVPVADYGTMLPLIKQFGR